MNASAVPWQDLAERLRPFIAGRVASSEIDDVLQDVFVRMHRSLPALRDDERFTSWLFQIARNAIAEHLRGRARHRLPDGDCNGDVAPDVDDDDRAATRSLAICVSMFVARLSSPYREAVTWIELEGHTVRDAAEMAGISVSGMKSRVQRGRAQLRDLFDSCCAIALDARGKVTDYSPRTTSCTTCK